MPENVAEVLHKIFISYFIALQFRSSHYFICFATESSFSFWGSDMEVARPGRIECPRSLVDVVVSWNIPFHIWIRKHVFKPLKEGCGGTAAVLLTYCVSSLLHGLNFQIFSVLFSLGCLTLLEHRLRHKLSDIYNACIQSKACPTGCGHQNRKGFAAVSVNTLFTVIAIIHLSFLGSAFDGKEDSSDMKHVLDVWFSLGFYSPCLAILTLILYASLCFIV
jgi:porcupine-like protein